MCRSSSPSRYMSWRCHECFGEPVFCTQCIQRSHYLHPFHRVSYWDGTSFSPSSLSTAGLTLNLGHAGQLCPHYGGQHRYSAQNAPFYAAQDVDMQRDSSADLATPGTSIASIDTHNPSFKGIVHGRATRFGEFTSDNTPSFSTTRISAEACDPTLPVEYSTRFWECLEPQECELDAGVSHQAGRDYSTFSQASAPTTIIPDVDTSQDPFFADDGNDECSLTGSEKPEGPSHPGQGGKRCDEFQCPLLTVIDTSGIHEVRTRFCRCTPLSLNPLHNQLINMALYPSSTERTRTVFTFRLLHHFDLTNLEGKTSAWQYYNTLRRLTSNVFPDRVVDRYRELMRALRQWRDLASRRRAGLPFDSTVQLKPGSLALFCPACPQPGVNLPENWRDDLQQYVPPLQREVP